MKILIIRNFPSYMAVKNNIYNIQEVGLAKALVRRGHICDIVFWTDKEEETVVLPVETGGKVTVFYKKGKDFLKNTVYPGIESLCENYDVIQPCEYNQIQAWMLAGKLPKKTVIYHGPYYSPFNKRYNLMCKAFDALLLPAYRRRGTHFLVKSNMARDFLAKKGIDNITVSGVGMDVQMLSAGDETCMEPLAVKMREDSGLKLLYIGRLEERRNILFLLDVFSRVCKEEKATLYMIGLGEQEYVDRVFAYAELLGIRDRIVYQEKMQQKYLSEVYSMAEFFLLPTEYEIFGMVLMEAMFFRNVVLTTRNGGSSTLMEHGTNGLVFEDKNADAWASEIIRLARDPETRQKMQEAASEQVREHYTWDALADVFLSAYHKRID